MYYVLLFRRKTQVARKYRAMVIVKVLLPTYFNFVLETRLSALSWARRELQEPTKTGSVVLSFPDNRCFHCPFRPTFFSIPEFLSTPPHTLSFS